MEHSHLKFHHFGLAVRRPEEARMLMLSLGYQLADYVFDPIQNVHLQMCFSTTQPAVEIIWPGATPGPVDKLVQRYPTGIVYHICYETENLAASIACLEKNCGLQPVCISRPAPALLFNGRKVSFYNVLGIGLIEILEQE